MEAKSLYFLDMIKRKGKDPNFWMSEEYIRRAGLIWTVEFGSEGFKTKEGDWFFPCCDIISKRFCSHFSLVGFQNEDIGRFWDYEYIYDPKNFLDLSGGRWKVFRRHVNTLHKLNWDYKPISEAHEGDVAKLLFKWAEGKDIYDPDIFTDFALNGDNRWGLFLNGKLKGINVADTNWKYINYRICFDSGENLLNEYLRYRFYISDWVQSQNKLVNDGGCMDFDSLKRFKDKLRPVEIKKIYTGEYYENQS